MTAQSRTTLKTYFETGDVPTQAQFIDLIDSFLVLTGTTSQTIPSAITVSGAASFSAGVSAASLNVVGNAIVTGSLTIGGLKPALTVKQQFFTSTGAYTYTPSTGMLYCRVEAVGAGGGSGGTASCNGSQVAGGGGGGGGGYSQQVFSAATIGVSQAGSIGAGGTAGSAGANAGATGGSTTFGALLTSTGGGGGAGGAATTLLTAAVAIGGAGGTGSGGTLSLTGGDGSASFAYTTNMIVVGTGGASAHGNGRVNNQGLGGAGFAGLSYGGGATGATSNPSTGPFAGAAGGNGIVIITEFCSQ